MTRDDWLKIVELKGCPEIPCRAVFPEAVWTEHGKQLEEVVGRYPEVFGGNLRYEGDRERTCRRFRRGQRWTDRWGSVWGYAYSGLEGQVVQQPLADWSAFKHFRPPEPATGNDFDELDWPKIRGDFEQARSDNAVAGGYVSHGFLFQRLYYLRGFENLMEDFGREDERLGKLIDMIVEFNLELVRRFLDSGADVIYFGDDLGMQDRLTISPGMWRRYIEPAYAKIFSECRRAGVHVYLHSDGYIADILGDLIEAGVTIVNAQDLVNGLDAIRRELKGRVCIDLDIDRQKIVPWGTPEQIERHIHACVQTLGSKDGGLMLICGIYPGTPLANIEGLARAMKECRMMFSQVVSQ